MRRHKSECNDPAFFDEVFSTADDLFLAMHDGEYPYVLPLNFVRQGQSLYLHCALEGHKLDCIRSNPNVAFVLSADVVINKEKSTTYYKSLCGTGRAVIVEDPAEKAKRQGELLEEYREAFYNPYVAAGMGQITEVINPEETRAKIAFALRTQIGRAHV